VARFSEQFIQQVLQATDVVELVGQYVALKKRGKDFAGLCPFHDDHKPSMYVSPAKQIFKCFVCGAGGSALNFVMNYDKLTFPEAVRALAERAHIAIPHESSAAVPGQIDKAQVVRACTFAARFFGAQLQSAAGRAALEYAHGRGLSDESIARFGLGYAPNGWEALLTAGRKSGLGQDLLVAAGLAVPRDGGSGCYDRFRNRLIFPILDPAGKAIAFGGRALDAEERAKYLNSSDTIAFDKSSSLYALNWARETITKTGCAIVVEGYLDALIPLQAGLGNVVATLGTALTERHVRLLSRYASEVVLIFDPDLAGAAAAERAMEVFLAQRLHVRVVTIPDGMDPCDFCLAGGPDALRDLVDRAPDAIQYVWSRRQEQLAAAGDNLADRGRIIDEFLRLIASSQAWGAIDGVRQAQLAQHIAHMLNVPAGEIQQQMRRMTRRMPRRSAPPGAVENTVSSEPGTLGQRHLLEVLLNRPDLFGHAADRVDPEDFSSAPLRSLATAMWELGNEGRLSMDGLLGQEELAAQAPLLVALAEEGERRGNFEQTLAGAVDSLTYHRSRRQGRQLGGEGDYNDETLLRIQEQARQPDPRKRPRIS